MSCYIFNYTNGAKGPNPTSNTTEITIDYFECIVWFMSSSLKTDVRTKEVSTENLMGDCDF